ncbi:MAG: hypothetical protein Q7S20_01005 [Gemmatimonadaceae bacterium]|nr:hypothetical protein [Gemmatimonadaceae bacterium]
MIGSSPFRRIAVIAALLTVGCGRGQAGKPPAPAEVFAGVVASANKRIEAGDYAGADRILADFALKAKGTTEGTEISFWRAVYMVDPANRTAAMAEGVNALDIYLATPGAKLYRPQAQVLRRMAQTVLTLRLAQATPKIVGRDTVLVTREEEIATLRDQLAKANAELERIKKRLANPSR